jgi:hypothetical protein
MVSVRARVVLGFLWLVSLVAVGAWAQIQPQQPVISGGDLGFRVERQDRGGPVGRLVVRVDGKWVEAGFAVGAVKVSTK